MFAQPFSLAEAPPAKSEGDAELLALAGDGFRTKTTDHFTIAYDTSYEVVRPLIDRLEGTYDAIRRFRQFNRLGADDSLSGLRVILFDRFEDYSRFAEGMDVPPEFVAGFYNYPTNTAVFCNSLNSPSLRAINSEMDMAREKLEDLRNNQPGSTADARQRLIERLSLLRAQRDDFVTRFNRFVIQHEAAHQVLFNLGVHVLGADNPTWLVEGLACQFEVAQTNPRGLLNGINHMRLADLRDALGVDLDTKRLSNEDLEAAMRRDQWMSLGDLLNAAGPRTSIDANMAFYYGQSWALVYYLHTRHGEAFSRYLRLMASREPAELVSRSQVNREFRDVFGGISVPFEREWIRRMLKVRLDRKRAGR